MSVAKNIFFCQITLTHFAFKMIIYFLDTLLGKYIKIYIGYENLS